MNMHQLLRPLLESLLLLLLLLVEGGRGRVNGWQLEVHHLAQAVVRAPCKGALNHTRGVETSSRHK